MTDAACSIASAEVGEPLAGTAVESVDTWILLEVDDPWAPKVPETEVLQGPIRQRLEAWLRTPRSRLQLVRRPGRPTSSVALTVVDAARRASSTIELADYQALLAVDFDGLRAEVRPLENPICLVCAHGRRDRCCAKHGSALFRSLCGRGLDLWQTSHLGGHRFAACALWLPEGLMYGRLRAADADTFVSAHTDADLGSLTHLRGRCALDRPSQAAEIFLRQRLGNTAIDSARWVSITSEAEDSWAVRFECGSEEHIVRVAREDMGVARPASCGNEPEPAKRFIEH